MTADFIHYYPKPIQEVYNAYKLAIQMVFNKNATEKPFEELVFGLKFSFRYNMNGGNCTVQFTPYPRGTEVRVHYMVVQAVGARCKAHDTHMTAGVVKVLGVPAFDSYTGVEVSFAMQEQPLTNTFGAAPLTNENASVSPKAKFCSTCGAPFAESASFCSSCGAKRQ